MPFILFRKSEGVLAAPVGTGSGLLAPSAMLLAHCCWPAKPAEDLGDCHVLVDGLCCLLLDAVLAHLLCCLRHSWITGSVVVGLKASQARPRQRRKAVDLAFDC